MSSPRPNQASQDKTSNTASILGSFFGSGAAYVFGHPFNTLGTRWQLSGISLTKTLGELSHPEPGPIKFPTLNLLYSKLFEAKFTTVHAMPRDMLSLWNSFLVGISYKLIQGTVRYGSQQYYEKNLKNHSDVISFAQSLSQNYSREIIKAFSGTCAGLTEAIICQIPDTLKIRGAKIEGGLTLSNAAGMLYKENISLMKGIEFTMMRNGIGGTLQLGTYALMLRLLGIKNIKDATPEQIIFSSWIAAMAMITLTMPFDNKKVHAQTNTHVSGKPGLGFYFKGTSIKLATKSPLATLALAFSQLFTKLISNAIDEKNMPEQVKEVKFLEKAGLFPVKNSVNDQSEAPSDNLRRGFKE